MSSQDPNPIPSVEVPPETADIKMEDRVEPAAPETPAQQEDNAPAEVQTTTSSIGFSKPQKEAIEIILQHLTHYVDDE
jgi:hypothetical protein